MRVIVSILLSYFLGSIPFGYLIVSAKTGSDIRETGSGGTGATNVSRRAGKAAGVLTLLLDALKGAAAVVVARLLLGDVDDAAWGIAASGILAMLGHIFPVWLGFRGGKGVANPRSWCVCGPRTTAVVRIWCRLVGCGVADSLCVAGIDGCGVGRACVRWVESLISPRADRRSTLVATLLGALLIVYAHRANIGRLLEGKENRFGVR